MSEKNLFGGGNPHSLYVPMSEVEQEAIARLVESGDLQVHIVGWGIVHKPRITFGDARLQIQFRATFDRPEVPVPVYYLDFELRTGSGHLLFGPDRQPTVYGGHPIQIAAGVFFDMVWDIQIRSIDPKLVKALVPGAVGLTNRLTDKDTGEMTLTGNMKLDQNARKILSMVREGEAKARNDTARRVGRGKKRMG